MFIFDTDPRRLDMPDVRQIHFLLNISCINDTNQITMQM